MPFPPGRLVPWIVAYSLAVSAPVASSEANPHPGLESPRPPSTTVDPPVAILLQADLAYIPGGEFDMGDHSGAGYPDERPAHRVRVSAFYLDRTEVTWALWNEVTRWAATNGYMFDSDYAFHPDREDRHPVCSLSWFDAVKWANARSERAGLRPVYYTRADRIQVYRAGQIDLEDDAVDWSANGFRLPTEAEWEYAARGGLEHQHYPWPSPGPEFAPHLDGAKANYWESGDPFEPEAACATTPAAYYDGRQTPAGPDMSNGFGLHDLAGNVFEWCWDRYHDQWYAHPDASATDTRGPATGYGRVLRGGSWISSHKYCRVAVRYMSQPGFRCHCYGLRLATRAEPPE